MKNLVLSVSGEQSELVQEFLEKILEEQKVIAGSASSPKSEVKRAQLTSEYVILLLDALQRGKTTVEAPGIIMQPVLSQLKIKLESQMAIMLDLMQDESLVTDNLVQVSMRSVDLLHIMRAMTYEALEVNSRAA